METIASKFHLEIFALLLVFNLPSILLINRQIEHFLSSNHSSIVINEEQYGKYS